VVENVRIAVLHSRDERLGNIQPFGRGYPRIPRAALAPERMALDDQQRVDLFRSYANVKVELESLQFL
jgi:hypothetical protein